MLSANARHLAPKPMPEVRIRKTKKVVINMEKIRRFIRIASLIILLTIVNASIQALLAQTQFRLEEIQSEVKKIDQKIGWLQYELADRISLQEIEKLTLHDQEVFNVEIEKIANDSSPILFPNPIVPPSILILDSPDLTKGETVVTRITDWLSGLGRTLAGVDFLD